MFNSLFKNYWFLIDRAVEIGAPPLLCGKASRDIKQEIEKLNSNARGRKLRWFSECLSVSINFLKCIYAI